MSANIAIGIQDFSTLIENHYFYVDKTDFIKEWWDCGDSVTLITRPRRFGKTLTMSMVEQFFSVEYSGRSDLFEDLKIWEDKKYRNIQGTYPVISLSFANVKEPTYQLAEKKICELIAQLYVKYDFITESGKLRDTEVKLYKKIMTDMEYVDATLSLYYLSGFLYKYYGKKVIILLDEYDTPMQEAFVDGYWEQLVTFTRSLFLCLSLSRLVFFSRFFLNASVRSTPVWLARQSNTQSTSAISSPKSVFSPALNDWSP